MSDPYDDIERNVTVIGKKACPSCGRPNTIRMNKSDSAYWCCRWPTGDDGRQCKAERRYSAKETAELVRKFRLDKLKMKGPKNGKETDQDNSGSDKRSDGGAYDLIDF